MNMARVKQNSLLKFIKYVGDILVIVMMRNVKELNVNVPLTLSARVYE